MIDTTIYANDEYAQTLIKGVRDIANKNSIDPTAFDENYEDLIPAILSGNNILIEGAPQTGKSTAICQAAVAMGDPDPVPVAIFSCDEGVRYPSVFGELVPNPNKGIDGDEREFVWQDGPLTKMMRIGGWFDAEELLQLPPEKTSMFMKVLDGAFIILKNGEIVFKHPNFRFIATGNPLCRGNKPQNQALMRRFPVKIGIKSISKRGFLMLGKSQNPQLADEFFNACYDLSVAVVAEGERLGKPDISCGITQLNALVGLIANDPKKNTLDRFKRKVRNTFINELEGAQVRPNMVDAFANDLITLGHIKKMYDSFENSLKTAVAGAQPQQTPPPAQNAEESGKSLLDQLRRIKI